METYDLKESCQTAYNNIKKHIVKTPLIHSKNLSSISDTNVFLKLENFQHTGSFKLRGAMNKILNLPDKSISVVAASSGNHGAAVAYSLRNLKMKGLVYVPENAVSSKVKLMKKYGVEIRYSGNDSLIAESSAISYAEENNLSFVSPYNDIDVISGQGTIGVEMINQMKDLDVVFITVGGGGLISGVGGYLKSINSNIKIIGCSPENSPVMKVSLNKGKIIEFDSLPTLSEGSAGGIERDSITYNFCEEFIDDFYLVSEEEIAENIKFFIANEKLLIEGAAAVSVAAFLKNKKLFKGMNVGIVICGGNIGNDTLKSIL
ncbi:MAG: threonine/serine dehydratase [Bacteroidota bacterium]|jgi:threonine dehydratase|uniref:Tryptophan synthase beta chain-like PALP domain-containing protein n=1 Tax=marine metagenome TaxID=408172 RepID=A0A381PCP1_9ZZZZ|nr:threonine/serine dehydratase [Bacteroidota bacterium]|tara:strand:+ start:2039 stop:2992 length:954 start_codon:yes stop_codon:yes gene_type:complete